MRGKTIAVAAIGLAGLAGTSQAHAATINVDAGCYIANSPINSSAAGFTPGGPVNFSFDGQLSASGVADGAGNLAQPLTAPILPPNIHQHTFSLAAQDQTNPAISATTQVNVTDGAATLSPSRARPRRKVKVTAFALIPGKTVYLHYVFHGKQRYRKKLGKASPPCGKIAKRTRFFPVNKPRVGIWTFQFDNRKKYSKHTAPRTGFRVQIFKIFK
jgi:hypothetical protein